MEAYLSQNNRPVIRYYNPTEETWVEDSPERKGKYDGKHKEVRLSLNIHDIMEEQPSFGDVEAQYTIRSQNIQPSTTKRNHFEKPFNLRSSLGFAVPSSVKHIDTHSIVSYNDVLQSWDVSSFGGQTIRKEIKKPKNRNKIENFWAKLEQLYSDYPAKKTNDVLKLSTTMKSSVINSPRGHYYN